MWKNAILFAGIISAGVIGLGQTWQGNHDESKVKAYTLPDVLTLQNGRKVRTAEEWRKLRRPEILKIYEENMYGPTPKVRASTMFTVDSEERKALGGKAIRKEVTVFPLSRQEGARRIHVLMYLPAGKKGPTPVFLGLNFGGNHAVQPDPAITLPQIWLKEKLQPAAPETRGREATRWPIEQVLARGYGVATAYYGDIEPDFNGGMSHGIRGAMPGSDAWGAVGAWAWGLRAIYGYLAKDKDVDPRRIAVLGHSRLGKAALWAGAQDERFSIVISNNSGEGGAALSRRNFGEDIWRLNNSFPHWFGRAYRQYDNREAELPMDQHFLIALVAPRPVYIASAAEDLHADPKGEFLAAAHAGPVYELFGKPGLGTREMPAVHQPIMKTIGYHVREGKHDVTAYDWDRFCDFADLHWAVTSGR